MYKQFVLNLGVNKIKFVSLTWKYYQKSAVTAYSPIYVARWSTQSNDGTNIVKFKVSSVFI